MSRIWSEEGKLERWLEVELAALDAWAEVGVVPADAARGSAPPPARPPRPASPSSRSRRSTTWPRSSTPSQRARARGALVPLRADVLRCRRHRARPADPRGRRADPRRDRARPRRRGRAGRGAPEHADDRPHARGARRADDLRPQARRLGLRARPGPTAAGPRARGIRVGKLSGAVGTYSATDPEVERLACEQLGLEPAPASTQIIQRDRHAELLSALALSQPLWRSSRSRSDTSPGPRSARCRSRSAKGRRARRRCRTRRTRWWPSGSAGWHGSCAPTRSSGSRTSPSGTSATSRTRRPSASSSRTRSSRSTTCWTSFAWLVEGLVVRPERMRRNLDVEPRPLLQPAPAARPRRRRTGPGRGVPARPGGTRCGPGRRSATSARSRAKTRRSPSTSTPSRSTPSFDWIHTPPRGCDLRSVADPDPKGGARSCLRPST